MGLMTYLWNRKRAKEQRRLAWELGVAKAWEDLKSDQLDADEFPGGVGDFGLSVDNPIPCPDPEAYFARLRTPSGAPVTLVGSRFSVRSSVTTKPVDSYPVCFEGKRAAIFVCIYAKRNSARPPDGFSLF